MLALLLTLALAPAIPPDEPAAARSDLFRRDAEALRPLAATGLGRAFLDATAELPALPTRTLLGDRTGRRLRTEAQAEALGPAQREALRPVEVTEELYYQYRYGSSLAYLRPLEILAGAGLEDARGRRLVDFGHGAIGHLRLLAALGAEAVGIEVDPNLPALYGEPGDQGDFGARGGRVRLVHGRFPDDPAVVEAVGRGFDAFLSKNTLKRGYVHPAGPVPPGMTLGLEADDAAFLAAVRERLVPGGLFLIYNLGPAPAPEGQPYNPMADIACPFPREAIEAAGFEVIALDEDDSRAARAVGRALGWHEPPSAMDLDAGLFASYTLLRLRETP